MSMGSQIKSKRLAMNWTQQVLADKLEVVKSAVANYENGVSIPKTTILYKLFDVLECDPNFLFQVSNDSDTFILENKTEIDSITNRRLLNKLGHEYIDEQMDFALSRDKYKKIAPSTNKKSIKTQDNIITLPYYNLPASAGTGVYLDNDVRAMIHVPNTKLNAQADFCIRVSGDSMEPKYSDGDIVLVTEQQDILVGEIGIFVVNDAGYYGFIKKRGETTLISLNHKYAPIAFNGDSDAKVKGKVIGIFKKSGWSDTERNHALFSFDEATIRAFANKHKIAMSPDNVPFWASVCKACLGIPSCPKDVVLKSKTWLTEHGMSDSLENI